MFTVVLEWRGVLAAREEPLSGLDTVLWGGRKPSVPPPPHLATQNWLALLGSHCSSRTMEGSLLAPLMNSSRESLPVM